MGFKESYTGNFLNLIKVIYKKLRYIHDGERLDAFSAGLGQREGYPLLLLLFIAVLENLDKAIGQRKNNNNRSHHIGKKKVKLSLFVDDMITYTENPKDSAKKILELINNTRSCRIQDQYTNINIFQYTSN